MDRRNVRVIIIRHLVETRLVMIMIMVMVMIGCCEYWMRIFAAGAVICGIWGMVMWGMFKRRQKWERRTTAPLIHWDPLYGPAHHELVPSSSAAFGYVQQ